MKQYQEPKVEIVELTIEEDISVKDPEQGIDSNNLE